MAIVAENCWASSIIQPNLMGRGTICGGGLPQPRLGWVCGVVNSLRGIVAYNLWGADLGVTFATPPLPPVAVGIFTHS